MSKDPVSMQITTTIDLTHILQRLEGEALDIFEENGRVMQSAIKKQWTGWKYKNRDRATVGNSRSGWGHKIQATEGKRQILFFNKAKGYYSGKSYASHVSRSKGATPEWELARDMIIVTYLPKMIKEVTAAINKGMRPGPRKTVRGNHSTSYSRITIT
tara:strand:+ start:124 stop:597 length:474 start_codon:yes stop_codon:yes gene_type:complete